MQNLRDIINLIILSKIGRDNLIKPAINIFILIPLYSLKGKEGGIKGRVREGLKLILIILYILLLI